MVVTVIEVDEVTVVDASIGTTVVVVVKVVVEVCQDCQFINFDAPKHLQHTCVIVPRVAVTVGVVLAVEVLVTVLKTSTRRTQLTAAGYFAGPFNK